MDRAAFFTAARPIFGGVLKQSQVDGTEALLAACGEMPVTWAAYVLATAFHETAHTMQPIAEYGKGKGRPYGRAGKYGQAQYGRGYVQLTWDANYERADRELKLGGALLKNFDLALQPTIAGQILVRGMTEGWFTGKKLADFLPDDYVGARKIINGTDRAAQIAEIARRFQAALTISGWGREPAKPQPEKPVETATHGGFFAFLRGLFA